MLREKRDMSRFFVPAPRKVSFHHIHQPAPEITKLYVTSKETLPSVHSKFPAKLRHSTSLASNIDIFEDPVDAQWVPPTKWDPCRKRNVLCEYCNGAVSILKRIDTACAYCNVVAHVRCIDVNCKDPAQYADWICPECDSEFKISRTHFLEKQTAIIRERNVSVAQTMIASNYRRHLQQRRYRNFKRSLAHLQSYARIIHRQHIFKEMRKLMLRPLRVDVQNCQGFDIDPDNMSRPILSIAVIEPSKREKIVWFFCIESHDQVMPNFDHAKVLIPGICAKHTIIITLLLRGEKRDTIIGQSSIALSEGSSWLSGGVFTLKMEAPEYFLKEFGNVIELETEKRGTLEFHLEALSGLRAECGSILGPNLDVYLKIAHTIKRSNNGMKVIKALSKSKSNSGTNTESLTDGSQSRFWCCVCDGYLYMYTRMGAGLRAVVDLKVVGLQFGLDDAGTADRTTVTIKMVGLPPLILSVGDHMESWRWRFALLSSYKYAKDPSITYDIYENRREMVDLYAELSSEPLKKFIAIQEGKLHKKAHEDSSRRVNRQGSMIMPKTMKDKDKERSSRRINASGSSSSDSSDPHSSHSTPRSGVNAGAHSSANHHGGSNSPNSSASRGVIADASAPTPTPTAISSLLSVCNQSPALTACNSVEAGSPISRPGTKGSSRTPSRQSMFRQMSISAMDVEK